MKQEHTPGPWEVRRWDGEEWPEKRWSIGARGTNGKAICISPRFATDGEEAEANARLIAAAPDLLEALKEIVIWNQRCKDATGFPAIDEGKLSKAHAAIAKATGKKATTL